ncbi:ScbR family autoregulator-binding transcription factor [Streptomyces sp. NPDC088387]|uniref:ScbR family autoregulator-binding transcription factor n=1 Tax=Streptomyces sp. NPDC088387 TaxID=3365859 RepID=UPI00382D2210
MARQQRALRTREALINSAAAVFDREGFSVASLHAISSLAGVSNGALHFHFANKAVLADAVQEAAAGRLAAIGALHEGRAGNALQLVVDASHELARALGADVVLRAGFELSRGQVPHGRPRDLHRQWYLWVEACLKRAEGEGVLNAAVPRHAASSVVAATTGFEVLARRDPQWLSARTVTRFWQLLLPRLADPALLGTLTPAGTPRPDAGPGNGAGPGDGNGDGPVSAAGPVAGAGAGAVPGPRTSGGPAAAPSSGPTGGAAHGGPAGPAPGTHGTGAHT